MQLFWLLGFVVAKKYTFSVELQLSWKKNPWKKLWKKPNKKNNNFSLKMCYFANVSCKESNLQYT